MGRGIHSRFPMKDRESSVAIPNAKIPPRLKNYGVLSNFNKKNRDIFVNLMLILSTMRYKILSFEHIFA